VATSIQDFTIVFNIVDQKISLFRLTLLLLVIYIIQGERWDSNPRVVEPQSTALTSWLRSPLTHRLLIIAPTLRIAQ
jgi:hypothetical protein